MLDSLRRRPVGLVSVALLLAFQLAPAQAPNLDPAQPLPGSPIVGPAPGSQKAAVVALGLGSSLMVFEDDRAGDSDLFAVRLGPGAVPLDSVPFPVTKAPGNQTVPKVVWNGANWLVVYLNQVDPGSGYFAYQFAAQRVSPAGQVLDATPIVLGSDDTGGNFGVASDGNNWVVSYTGYSSGSNGITAKRISPAGVILDPAGVTVFPATYYIIFGVSTTFGQNEYVFTWIDNGLKARRFTPQMQPIDAAPISTVFADGTLTSNGSQFFIVRTRQTSLYTSEVVANRLNASLAPLEANPISVSGFGANVNYTEPQAAWDGSQWIVSWLTLATQTPKAARVTTSGVVLDPAGVTIPENDPSYLYGFTLGGLPGGGALLAWHDVRFNGTNDVFGTAVSGTGAPGTEQCFSIGAEALRNPRVTAGLDQLLVTYRAELAATSRVLVQRLDAVGAAIDGEGIEVASAVHTGLYAGGVAWNGSVYLVTWSDAQQGKVFARRFLPSGGWLDAAPIFVMNGWGSDAAALGSDFLVTGLRSPGYPQYVSSYAARVRGSDGLVLDNPAPAVAGTYATRARVVTLGGRYLIATESHVSHDSNQAGIVLNFVDTAGVVTAPLNVGPLNIQDWGSIDIASAGTSALVIGQTGSNWTNTDVYARRVLPDGSMPAPMFNVTATAPFGQSRASVMWTGTEYAVSHLTFQNNVWSYDLEPDVYVSRITEAGVLVGSAAAPLWNGEDYEVSVDGDGTGGGRGVFAASTYVDGSYAAFRISLRTLRAAGVTPFGVGTPGCTGPEQLDAISRPFIGNAAFGFVCTHAPAGASGLLVASTVAVPGGADPFGVGVVLHVGMASPTAYLTLPMNADAAGVGRTPVALPASPSLVGSTFHFQAAFVWNGPCTPSPLGISTSSGLSLQIQAP